MGNGLDHISVLAVTATYWAMSTMATVGYGDVIPIQVPEKVVAMVGMLVGVTVFAYAPSSCLALLYKLQSS